MKNLVSSLVLCGTLYAASSVPPSVARADENAASTNTYSLSIITRETPKIADLQQQYAAFGQGALADEQKKKRDDVRSLLFYALLARGQALEMTDQLPAALTDYTAAERLGFYHNVESRRKVDMASLYLGQARLALLQKRWDDASTHAHSAAYNALTPLDKATALDLESRASLYKNSYLTAQTRAEAGVIAAREAASPPQQAIASRRLGAVLFLRGDLAGARAKWKEASSFDGRLANIDPYDSNQVALNAAISKNSDDLEARLNRARYFNWRANVLAGKQPSDSLDALDEVPDNAEKTRAHQGGWSNVIELRNPTPQTLRQDAIADTDFVLIPVFKQPSPFVAPLHIERARARRGLTSTPTTTPQSLLQISDDYLEAHYLAPTDVEVALEAGRFFAENKAPSQALRLLSLVLARSERPDPLVLRQRDAIFAAFPKKPAIYPPTIKSALDWKNRGNELLETAPLNALDCYRKAVQIDPKFADGWNNIATVFARFEMADRQLSALNRTLQLDPKHFIAYANRAALWANLGDFKASQADAEKALELASTPELRVMALIRRAEAKAGLQNQFGAIQDFDAALDIDPENSAAWAKKGSVYLRGAKFGLADVALEKAVEREPNAQTWAALAIARSLKAPNLSFDKFAYANTAWENAAKTATRADWVQTLRLITQLYQSGPSFQTSPASDRLTEFYRAAITAKDNSPTQGSKGSPQKSD